MKRYATVIFDMDGCLVDTEPVINRAAILGLKEWGIDAKPDDFIPFIGAGETAYIGGVAEKYGLAYEPKMKTRVYDIYLDIVEEMLKPMPGAIECLTKLEADGYKLALASSADHLKIDANLRIAGIKRDLFYVILGAEDVVHKKPAPDIYLAAAKKLDVEPGACFVVEDAINGIQAAKSAGMACVAVQTTFSEEKLRAAAPDFIAGNLFDVYKIVKGA